jgi:hypothetical protein
MLLLDAVRRDADQGDAPAAEGGPMTTAVATAPAPGAALRWPRGPARAGGVPAGRGRRPGGGHDGHGKFESLESTLGSNLQKTNS